ncbi:hypothetical protein SAMD00023353_0200280 [Rosellinia necatrix]|uniref:Uncharacterized protein n=1 Tax=Rosellinia necatrix TaxID=77044 RepID=A0A1S7UK14_ROSNE|nr:hypothetical protein SAMD00023353_0200280 [Rosellinia necatrix]
MALLPNTSMGAAQQRQQAGERGLSTASTPPHPAPQIPLAYYRQRPAATHHTAYGLVTVPRSNAPLSTADQLPGRASNSAPREPGRGRATISPSPGIVPRASPRTPYSSNPSPSGAWRVRNAVLDPTARPFTAVTTTITPTNRSAVERHSADRRDSAQPRGPADAGTTTGLHQRPPSPAAPHPAPGNPYPVMRGIGACRAAQRRVAVAARRDGDAAEHLGERLLQAQACAGPAHAAPPPAPTATTMAATKEEPGARANQPPSVRDDSSSATTTTRPCTNYSGRGRGRGRSHQIDSREWQQQQQQRETCRFGAACRHRHRHHHAATPPDAPQGRVPAADHAPWWATRLELMIRRVQDSIGVRAGDDDDNNNAPTTGKRGSPLGGSRPCARGRVAPLRPEPRCLLLADTPPPPSGGGSGGGGGEGGDNGLVLLPRERRQQRRAEGEKPAPRAGRDAPPPGADAVARVSHVRPARLQVQAQAQAQIQGTGRAASVGQARVPGMAVAAERELVLADTASEEARWLRVETMRARTMEGEDLLDI